MATTTIIHSISAYNVINPANTALHLQFPHAPAVLILFPSIKPPAKTTALINTTKMVPSAIHALTTVKLVQLQLFACPALQSITYLMGSVPKSVGMAMSHYIRNVWNVAAIVGLVSW